MDGFVSVGGFSSLGEAMFDFNPTKHLLMAVGVGFAAPENYICFGYRR